MEAHTLTLGKLSFFLMLLAVLYTCDRTGPEPVSIGHYLIDNKTSFTLKLEADNTQFDEDVPPDTIFHFFTIEVGTGGSAAPHHIFNHFFITAIINNVDSILYEGVYPQDSEDWEVRNTQVIKENPGTEYYLTIPR